MREDRAEYTKKPFEVYPEHVFIFLDKRTKITAVKSGMNGENAVYWSPSGRVYYEAYSTINGEIRGTGMINSYVFKPCSKKHFDKLWPVLEVPVR